LLCIGLPSLFFSEPVDDRIVASEIVLSQAGIDGMVEMEVQDGDASDRSIMKVFDTLQGVEACLLQNKKKDIVYFLL
jgi:hypothetical protein